MQEEKTLRETTKKTQHKPFLVRLPGFITEEDIGLGDVIKRTTGAFGIKPCGGCEQRAASPTAWSGLPGAPSDE